MFGVHLQIGEGWTAVSVIFLAQTALPSFTVAELFTRGNISLYFLRYYTDNTGAILAASTSLWLLNLIFPAVAGYFFILRKNFFKTRNQMRKATLFIPVLLATAMMTSAPDTKVVPGGEMCQVQKDAFQAGESLTHKVYYNAGPMWVGLVRSILNLATLTIEKENMRTVFREAVSYSSFDWFFKVRDKLETYMDPVPAEL